MYQCWDLSIITRWASVLKLITMCRGCQTGGILRRRVGRNLLCFCPPCDAEFHSFDRPCTQLLVLTLNLLTTTIVAPPSNASKWQMGFNSAFKGLIPSPTRNNAEISTLIHRCPRYIYCILLLHIYYLCNLVAETCSYLVNLIHNNY